MDDLVEIISQARMLILRLERISVDSIWAHRSSGLRGSLLKWVDQAKKQMETEKTELNPEERQHITTLIIQGYEILENAAKELFS